MSNLTRGLNKGGTAPSEGQGATHDCLLAPRGRRRRRRLNAWQQQFLGNDSVDVTICIANWNCKELLRACLESLHDQPQGVRLETVVVDNASTDGAADMVAAEFPEVILERNPTNVGFARANNQAAEQARGRYLFFLNNDTVVPAGALGRLVDYLERDPQVGLLGPRLRDGDGHTQVSYRLRPSVATLLHRTCLLRWTGLLKRAYRRYRRQEFDPDSTRRVEVLMGAAMLLPRDVFFNCGGWDEDFVFGGEDLDLSARVGRYHPVVYHPQVTITHYGRVSTRRHIGYASSNMAIGFLRYLRKSGHPRPALLFYKLVVTLDAPILFLNKAIQFLWRRLCGDYARAEKSRLAMVGAGHFLFRGLAAFWRT
jgi:N-acetylglucosaminyl-diphospho-decaprenol L-rhamnosyltransferase